jgi:hypothetical protein
MGPRLLKFWSLTQREKKFFCEAGFLFLLSYLCVMTVAFRRIDKVLRASWKDSATVSDYADDIKLIDLSLSRVRSLIPWKRQCLSRSIAAFIMLRRRGIPAAVVTGVRFAHDSSLLAHAWVDTDDGLIGENAAFVPLMRIGREHAD